MRTKFFIRFLATLSLALVLCITGTSQARYDHEGTSPTLRIDTAFVWVPTTVHDRNGETLRSLNVGHLHLSDNGVSEKVTQINTDGLPTSLVILMQTGGPAKRFLSSYSNLPWLIHRWVGDSIHEITLVTFDSHIQQIWHFPNRTDGAMYAMTHQRPGDDGAAIEDAVAFGVRQLQAEPGRFRRIVLLLSQEGDIGSSTNSRALLEQLGTSSTVVYSLTFAGGRKRRAAQEEKRDDSTEQALVKITAALESRTAEKVADLSGGSQHKFEDQASFNSAMLEALSDFRNGVTLGFQPSRADPGFHRIEVQIDSPKLRIRARRAYWVPSN